MMQFNIIVLVGGAAVPAWQAHALEVLSKIPNLRMQVIVQPSAGFALLPLREWLVRIGRPVFSRASLTKHTIISSLELVQLENFYQVEQFLSSENIAESQADLLFNLTAAPVVSNGFSGDVVQVCAGAPGTSLSTPIAFWEYFYEESVFSSTIYRCRDGHRVYDDPIRTTISRVDWIEKREVLNCHLWKSSRDVVRTVTQFQAGVTRDIAHQSVRSFFEGVPNLSQRAKMFSKRVVKKMSRYWDSKTRREQWQVARLPYFDVTRESQVRAHFDGQISLEGSYRFAGADPHVIEYKGGTYVFYEEIAPESGKGTIKVISIDADGVIGASKTVLAAEYHVSNPFVFEFEDQFYMVPESAANQSVDIYVCRAFPDKWSHAATIMTGISCYDPTLIRRDGRWWLFATVSELEEVGSSDELFIFSAPELLGQKWESHPMNPVISDPRLARPAGRIIERNGGLFRPAQDCSKRYGFALNMREIETLSRHEYSERTLWTVYPDESGMLRGLHSISTSLNHIVIDILVSNKVGQKDSFATGDLKCRVASK